MDVPKIDLPGMFLAAARGNQMIQQGRLARLQMEMQQEEQRRKAMLPEARASYFSGDSSLLQRASPLEYQELEKGKLDMERTKLQINKEAAKAKQETGLRTTRTLLNSIDVVLKNPAMYPTMRQRLGQMASSGAIELDMNQLPEQMPAPDQLQQYREMYMSIEKDMTDPKVTDDMAEAAAGLGLDLRDPNAWQDQRFQQAVQQKAAGKSQNAGKDPASELRKEFQSQQTIKNTQDIAQAFEKVSSTSSTAAGDMSLVYGYMRLLDPGSTVREGEYANASNAGAVSERLRSMYNRAIDGTMLSDNIRSNFKTESQRLWSAQMRRYNSIANEYRRLARKNSLDPADVVLDLGEQSIGRSQSTAASGASASGSTPVGAGAGIKAAGQKFAQLRKQGMSSEQAMQQLLQSGEISQEDAAAIMQRVKGGGAR